MFGFILALIGIVSFTIAMFFMYLFAKKESIGYLFVSMWFGMLATGLEIVAFIYAIKEWVHG